jgi:hypothetical protein
MLVQDYDLKTMMAVRTLRLCFATPPRWLEDGKEIVVERALTQFGNVSFQDQVRLEAQPRNRRNRPPPRTQSTRCCGPSAGGAKDLLGKSAADHHPAPKRSTFLGRKAAR